MQQVRFLLCICLLVISSGLFAKNSDIVISARKQIGVTICYDSTYQRLAYPGGEVHFSTGVCTDVIIRALRDAKQIDLQKCVHEDMKANFSSYPNN